jgi:uncharacterized membrane protein YeiH
VTLTRLDLQTQSPRRARGPRGCSPHRRESLMLARALRHASRARGRAVPCGGMRVSAALKSSVACPTPSNEPPPATEQPTKIVKLTRYPELSISAGNLLRTLDYVGTAAFGFTGGLTAASVGMDVLGVAMVGTITAVGGGTIRDGVFLSKPPFWTEETEYLGIASAFALLAFGLVVVGDDVITQHDVVEWGDALGLGAFAVIGANNALALAMPTSICILAGMATATFGGVVRDVVCQRPPRILHSRAEIYATCAVLGASVYIGGVAAGIPALGAVTGVSAAVGARWAAREYQLRLPTIASLTENRK